jgi:sugar lactone lactonase YvrE
MRRTFNWFFIFLTLLVGLPVKAQDIITTIAGGGLPNNIPALSANLNFPNSVAVDKSGNVFVVGEADVVFKVNAAGVLTVLAGNGLPGYSGDGGPATSASLMCLGGIAVDGSSNLFISDYCNDRIRRVDAATGIITTVAGSGKVNSIYGQGIGDGGPATDAYLNFPMGVAIDASGNLFIVDSSDLVIRKVDATTQIITTVAGNGTYGFSGDNGPATSASLSYPQGVAVDGPGNLFIADTGNYRIRRVDAATQVITTVAGDGIGGHTGDNGPATSASLFLPECIAVDRSGDIFIVDTYGERIRRVDAATHIIATVAGDGMEGFSGDTGPATSASLNLPEGVAVNGSGDFFIADTYNMRIRRVDAATQVITTVAGNGTSGFSGDNGPATSASLSYAQSVALDSSGNLFIADSGNLRIRRVDAATQVITTVAGNGTPGFSGDNGPATSASLGEPYGIAVDAFGNLFIADTYNNRIRRVDAATQIITTVAGNGQYSFSGDNGPATSASLSYPQGVAVDGSGNLFISDTENHRIRKVDANTAIITTIAGGGSTVFYTAGGPATSARLLFPYGLAVDAGGNVYFADGEANGVYRLDASTGFLFMAAGNGNYGFGGDGGLATQATLAGPPDVILDTAGDLLIVDTGNFRIRRVSVGPTARLTSSSLSLAFGNQILGVTSAAHPLTLKNPSGAALTVTSISIDGPNAGDFAETDTCGGSIGAGGSCTLSVTFTPSATGAESGFVSVSTDGNFGLPILISLSGSGVTPVVRLSPSSLSFGNQLAGTTGSGQVVTLTNGSNASAQLTITNIAATMPYAETNTCAAPLAAGASCTITVTFTPAASGSYAGAVIISYLGPNSPQVATLLGTGGASPAAYCPTSARTVNPLSAATDRTPASSEPPKATQQQVLQAYGSLPLSFEAQRNEANREVFLSRGQGYDLALDHRGDLRLSLKAPHEVYPGQQGSAIDNLSYDIQQYNNDLLGVFDQQQEDQRTETDALAPAVMHFEMVGANPKPRVAGLEELAGKSNYFYGSDPTKWRTKVPTFARVRYRDVYPGVDLVFYGNRGQLEYDFVVGAGTDPKVIRLNVEGARKVEIDSRGNLLMTTEAGRIQLQRPIVYQAAQDGELRMEGSATVAALEKHYVEGRFVMEGQNTVGLEVGNFDPRQPLVIDPILNYSTYLGGLLFDGGLRIAVDSACNAYVAGVATSPNFPTAGAFQPNSGGGTCYFRGREIPCPHAFVAKLDPTGTSLIYSTFLGGSGADVPTGIAVDSSGDAYLTGSTPSSDFPTTAGAFQGSPHGQSDAFVTKLNPAGNSLVYSTLLGGSRDDVATGIAVDASGNAYVSGTTKSTDFPTTAGVFQSTLIDNGACKGSGGNGHCPDGFVTKLNPTGTALVYSSYLGGSDADGAAGIAIDDTGAAYVTGSTISSDFPTVSAIQASFAGGVCGPTRAQHLCADAFVSKVNPSGSALLYSTYLGGNGDDAGTAIALDPARNAYVAGITNSTNLAATRGAAQPAFSGGMCGIDPATFACPDAFVAKLNPRGSALTYLTYLGGSNYNFAFDIAADGNGNAYVVGATGSNNFPVADAIQGAFSGGTCSSRMTVSGTRRPFSFACPTSFVTKLNPTGTALAYSTYLGGHGGDMAYLGGNGGDIGFGIAVDSAGSVYVTGATINLNFPTVSAFQPANAGIANAFVAKVSVPTVALSAASVTFAGQALGTTSAPRTVTLNSSGDDWLNVKSIVASGDFAQTNKCRATLPPGANCTLSVTFTPRATGTLRGALTITDNAYDSPQTVSLCGTGVSPGVPIAGGGGCR